MTSDKLDQEIATYLSTVQETLATAHHLSVPQMRETFHELRMAPGNPADVHEVADIEIPAPHGAIKCRMYKPSADNQLPVLVWFHGGGWVLGDLDSADMTCRDLASQSGCMVLSVDYRLAPEHQFPAAFNDGQCALEWISKNASSIGADPSNIAIGGDSAGANIATCVCLASGDMSPAVKFQLLVYPVIEADFNNQSYLENADGYFLTRNLMQWFWDHYVPEAHLRNDSRVSPLSAPLQNLPDAWVMTVDFDPLRDEGIKYAKLLKNAGVKVTTTTVHDAVHGFFTMPIKAGAAARSNAALQLKNALVHQY